MQKKSERVPMKWQDWMNLANEDAIKNKFREAKGYQNYVAVLHAANRMKKLDWIDAVALVHMVYGWMPTMLRPPEKEYDNSEKKAILAYLKRAKAGKLLCKDELETLKRFSNRSIVGASKLLHALNPTEYMIWDSRVARSFLWPTVSAPTYQKVDMYLDYIETLNEWSKIEKVSRKCNKLRDLNHDLYGSADDRRMIELVLYHGGAPSKDER